MTASPAGPRVSVVIATHNRAAMLEECARAVLGQQDVPGGFDLVIIDSASTDDTARTAERIRANDPDRVRFVREAVAGCARARNRGAQEAADAEFLAFLDDDAVPGPGWLGALVEAAEQTGADAVGGKTLALWPAEGRPRWITDRIAPFFNVPIPEGDAIAPLTFPNVPAPGNMLVRRDAFDEGGRFREQLGRAGNQFLSSEDFALFEWMSRTGRRTVYAPRAVVNHRVHRDRLRFGCLLRKMADDGITEALVGRTQATIGLGWFGYFVLPVAVVLRLVRGRPDEAIVKSLLFVRHTRFLLERLRMRSAARFGPSGL